MKYVSRLAFVGVLLSPIARAEVTTIKKQTAQLQAFENLESKLAALENYSVRYLDSDKKTYVVMKSAPAPHEEKSQDLSVELRAAKRKS